MCLTSPETTILWKWLFLCFNELSLNQWPVYSDLLPHQSVCGVYETVFREGLFFPVTTRQKLFGPGPNPRLQPDLCCCTLDLSVRCFAHWTLACGAFFPPSFLVRGVWQRGPFCLWNAVGRGFLWSQWMVDGSQRGVSQETDRKVVEALRVCTAWMATGVGWRLETESVACRGATVVGFFSLLMLLMFGLLLES